MLTAVAIGVAVLAAFFALGYGLRRYWVAAIPFLLPLWLFAGTLLGDDEDCREFCGAGWAAVYGVVGLIGALALAGAVTLGVRLRNRAS